jgi:hypothetical protein
MCRLLPGDILAASAGANQPVVRAARDTHWLSGRRHAASIGGPARSWQLSAHKPDCAE